MKNFWEKAFALVVALWVVLIVYCLTQLNPDLNPTPEPVPDTQPVQVVQEVIEAEPKVEPVNEAPEPTKMPQIVNATITAYCICEQCCGKTPDHPAYGITASGREAEPYVSVAVDPFMIELGSTVYIDYGDGVLHEFRADDTGANVAGAHIDVCYPDHQSALEHGVKTAHVFWKEA